MESCASRRNHGWVAGVGRDRPFSQPGFEGQREALLSSVPDRFGDRCSRCFTKGAFGRARSAQMRGHFHDCAKEIQVDQRRPDLERVAHAGDIRVAKELNLKVLAYFERGDALLGRDRFEVEPRSRGKNGAHMRPRRQRSPDRAGSGSRVARKMPRSVK